MINMAVAADVPLVLVTGASGFLATHLVQQLLVKEKVKVRGTVRSLKNEKKVQPLYDLVPNAKYPLELVEADLENEDSWKEAVKGCSYVYHVASPFPSNIPADENEIIKPAVNGTLNVFKAIASAGGVKRVVLTSSVAAITGRATDTTFTEKDWAPVEEDIGAYQKSKTLAEKAAWDFLKDLEEDKKFELAVVNPALVVGPLLSAASKDSTSTASVLKLLNNELPALVNISFNLVDVRDVAAAHIAAMEVPEAAGNRHILVGMSPISMKEMAEIIGNEFRPQGYRIPSFVMPKFGLWFYKAFDPTARLVYPMLGKVYTYSNEKMRNVLGIQPIDQAKSIIDTCYNLIEMGVVPKKPRYRGPPSLKENDTDQTAETKQGDADHSGMAHEQDEDAEKQDVKEQENQEEQSAIHHEEQTVDAEPKQDDVKKQENTLGDEETQHGDKETQHEDEETQHGDEETQHGDEETQHEGEETQHEAGEETQHDDVDEKKE